MTTDPNRIATAEEAEARGCTDVVIIDAHVHAICRTPHIAARIAELLDRHGLADIPDTPADLAT